MSVAEADEEAIKWFLIAAKWGLAEGMNSLARKLWADNGLKTDQHVAWETEEVRLSSRVSPLLKYHPDCHSCNFPDDDRLKRTLISNLSF